ncbi:MAG: phosphate ABC transporter substrate-binding protein PstS [Bifidobacteriaceae bacterium]|nr:phosphate ABC transporter substrate-binding protein PstS [Bifidobacteriaceae bacterium]
MRKNAIVRAAAVISSLALLTSVAACGDNPATTSDTGSASASETVTVEGTFQGAGASSQSSAVEAWIDGFTSDQPGATINYDATGSGAGVKSFLSGNVVWAGSDAALSNDEVEQSKSRCANGTTAFDVPVYISPIAIVYNLSDAGLNGADKHLQLSADTIAKIFDGKITKWNDDAIKAENPDVDLPDLAITPVYRSDKSGTTKNFQNYLSQAAPDSWTYDPGENWPGKAGQGAAKTSGVISAVSQAQGTIGYADASQAGGLGTVAVKVGDSYVPYSADAAAKVVDASPMDDSATGDNRVVIKIDHATTTDGAYPVVLVSYAVACPAYDDTNDATFVRQWLTYIVSADGQQAAADAAGSAPMSDTLREKVMTSINAIQTA